MTEPQRFRFVVGSAQEAVTVLRERLGDQARVVSVRQVEGTGLAKFLRAPKLEVIAEVSEVAEPEPVLSPIEAITETQTPSPMAPASASPPAEAIQLAEEPAQTHGSGLIRLLRAGGMPAQLLARLQSEAEWRDIEALPSGRALTRVSMMLREQFRATPPRPLGDRIAFIGSPGSGTTTALCKWVAAEVFVRSRRGAVLKLDLDRANPGDALGIFCEALGVYFARSTPDVPTLRGGEFLAVDVPGVVPGCHEEEREVIDGLAPLFTTSRVLVVNAAYEAPLIKRSYQFAERAGCTHVAFTHLDELTQWGKLWEFLVGQSLTPIFLGTGPNIAGDLDDNVFDATLARTFPEAGLQAA